MIPDHYTVGRDGRVWIMHGNDFRICHEQLNNRGYRRIQVCFRKRRKWYLIHHLVMFYHGPPKPPGKWEIGHRDGNMDNCAISNLFWTTRSDNTKQAWSDGKREGVRELQRAFMKAMRGTQMSQRKAS